MDPQSFLCALRRFGSLKGWPAKIHSDPGSQLQSASKELTNILKDLNWKELQSYGLQHGTEWTFSPADAPWYNGSTEALVKTTKRALQVTIGDHAFTFSEFLTIMFETADLVNQRPIGKKPQAPLESSYLCPNDLILGRASSAAPQGSFLENVNEVDRYYYIQSVINNFWKRWSREVLPHLVLEPKWHVEKRNVKTGDIMVFLLDSSPLRGEWIRGRVSKVMYSEDKRVRRVEVTYKRGDTSITVLRPVQRLIVMVPNEKEMDTNS